MRAVVYKVEKNIKYGDFRVVKYVNGVWENEKDNNWSKYKADIKCKSYNEAFKSGHEIF